MSVMKTEVCEVEGFYRHSSRMGLLYSSGGVCFLTPLSMGRDVNGMYIFCVCHCVYVGKTTLADALLASNGIISQRLAGKVNVHLSFSVIRFIYIGCKLSEQCQHWAVLFTFLLF